ncbi:hypothetical protein ACOMHN_023787 [Nucella lapillus]
MACMTSQDQQLSITAHKVSFSYNNNAEDAKDQQSSLTCEIILTAPPGKSAEVFHVNLRHQTCVRDNSVLFSTKKDKEWRYVKDDYYFDRFVWTGCESSKYDPLPTFVNKKPRKEEARLWMVVRVKEVGKGYRVEMEAHTGRALSQGRELQVVQVTSQGGYVQPSGYNPESSLFFQLKFYHNLSFSTQNSQHIMISVPHLHITCSFNGMLTLYTESKGRTDKRWGRCGVLPPLPEVYTDVNHVTVAIKGDNNPVEWRRQYDLDEGFRLLYSLHKKYSAPTKVHDNTWNCSSPHWPDFEFHLRCNLVAECEGTEDEAECHHEVCGEGGFVVLGRCYLLGQPADKLTYYQARGFCSNEGGYLASFNTNEEMEAVMERVWLRSRSRDVYVGLTFTPRSLDSMYKLLFMWDDGTVAHTPPFYFWEKRHHYYLCEFDPPSGSKLPGGSSQHHQPQPPIRLAVNVTTKQTVPSVRCPDDHLTHNFLACDLKSSCWAKQDKEIPYDALHDLVTVSTSMLCDAPEMSELLYFVCSSSGTGFLPFTLVCDHRVDCFDGSDEDFCVHAPCPEGRPLTCGGSQQCISETKRCDMLGAHCRNSIDDKQCVFDANRIYSGRYSGTLWGRDYRPPTMITFYDSYKKLTSFKAYELGSECPPTHFECPLVAYRFPVYVRCNGVPDCPYHEDEADCETYTCPGFYRCRQSRVCLHPKHMCDGISQCPQLDDEFFCSISCPSMCSCHGFAFTCAVVFPAHEYPDIRYLDASGSGVRVDILVNNAMLVYLSLNSCNLTDLALPKLSNLKVLDVSYNRLTTVTMEHLRNVSNLNNLVLTRNPLTSLFPSQSAVVKTFPTLQKMDMSFVEMADLDLNCLQPFSGLTHLNLSGSSTQSVYGALDNPHLRVLDLTGSELVDFPRVLLKNLSRLTDLHTDNFRLCCIQSLPDHLATENCHGPSPVFSTCEHLLGSESQRMFLYVLTPVALLGNSFVIVMVYRERKQAGSIGVFMSNVCWSKLVMGVYLSVLCVCDRVFSGSYLWEDTAWRSSIWCKLSSFLFFLSCQVSVFIEVCMTVERGVSLTWRDKNDIR